MQCRMVEMRYKEVINICDGCRLGFVGDVEVLLPEGRVTALIVPGPCRFFGLFSRGHALEGSACRVCRKRGEIVVGRIGRPFHSPSPPLIFRAKSARVAMSFFICFGESKGVNSNSTLPSKPTRLSEKAASAFPPAARGRRNPAAVQ